ncbi:MAG: prenyltransferase/squalene oxidase repeat-containing protein [Pirellula sp.]|jgi:squalene-hopene/tetraprenyl-beta-curcumene cyclase
MNSGTIESSLDTRIRGAIEILLNDLAVAKEGHSHWSGKLSDSALSTATAISALSVCRQTTGTDRFDLMIEKGSVWLSNSQNADGGFGDTDQSLSNIATTLLVLAAWELAGHTPRFSEQSKRAWDFVDRLGRWDGLRKRYGKDKTFVVPIMTNCAIAGLIGWKEIPTLPFEAAALPQSWYRFAKMPVVSYAVPALVAIGQAQFVHNPPKNPIAHAARRLSQRRTLQVLLSMQPESGGYLEATPLTSFVLMSLASIGQANSPVCQSAVRFLEDSMSPEGSWPIDTNLATWVTSLTTTNYYSASLEKVSQDFNNTTSSDSEQSGAPNTAPPEHGVLNRNWRDTIDWILSCQHRARHPFTGADPGGWGWTDLSGSVPDADDTPAALLALNDYAKQHPTEQQRILESVTLGCRWLLSLQNRDGGWPTFCRGWGQLPFDRSGSDLTAHAIRALFVWRDRLPQTMQSSVAKSVDKGWRYLKRTQQLDGSWLPLWFGNQDRIEEDNPFYGTARVLLAYAQCGRSNDFIAKQGVKFLLSQQNRDGGWGGGPSIRYTSEQSMSLTGHAYEIGQTCSTIEETAIVLEGIMACSGEIVDPRTIMRGLEWLSLAIHAGYHHTSQPIGFYFAKLWYHERQYPLAFSLSALRKGLEFCQR